MSARTLVLSLSALALSSSYASAAIIGVAGSCIQISPPATATAGSLAAAKAFAWNEQTNITVGTGIFCDETQNPGGSVTPIPGILTGTFDSHMIHFEGIPGLTGVSGSVAFSQPIVGVIFQTTSLNNTDVSCGAPSTVYPTLYPLRQFGTSFFSLTGNTLTFQLNNIGSAPLLVEVRVLTHSVPAPGSLALLGMGGTLAFRRRRV